MDSAWHLFIELETPTPVSENAFDHLARLMSADARLADVRTRLGSRGDQHSVAATMKVSGPTLDSVLKTAAQALIDHCAQAGVATGRTIAAGTVQ